MTRPIYVWRLSELADKPTRHTADDGAELKVASDLYRVWLVDNTKVRVDELQVETGRWKTVEEYPAKTA